jgi:hypothetical protein
MTPSARRQVAELLVADHRLSVQRACRVVRLSGAKEGLQARDVTLAQLLKAQGYMTAQFGKNHLGDADETLPTAHGFDEFMLLPGHAPSSGAECQPCLRNEVLPSLRKGSCELATSGSLQPHRSGLRPRD